jgi:hypothetical protein
MRWCQGLSSTFALTSVCVWFSTEHGDEDEDDEDEDGDDEDEDEDDEDEGEDDFEEDEDESFIECKLAFYKVRSVN